MSKILSNKAYIGNTVNNQSTVKSYKIKKKVHRPKEEHLRFENTHELIIDKAIFDAVQKLRENRKRPTKRNHPKSIFSGKVFCHDCGEKMRVSHDKRKDGSYRVSFECVTAGIKGKGYCSTHYINEEILKEAVLDDLKRVTDLARSKPKLFSDYVTQLNGKDISKKLKAIHLELSKLEKRENELITLFKKLYEDFALERISEEIFNSLSQGYLEEQKTLKEQIPIKKSELLEVESATKSTETFIAKANKYIVFDELTSELISIFVDKIVIHEKSQRYSRSAIQIIDIHYLDVGILDYASEAEARKKQNIPHYGNTEIE